MSSDRHEFLPLTKILLLFGWSTGSPTWRIPNTLKVEGSLGRNFSCYTCILETAEGQWVIWVVCGIMTSQIIYRLYSSFLSTSSHRILSRPFSKSMDDCGSGDVVQKIECIVTYGGSISDICINYTLLVLDITFCAWWLTMRHQNVRKPLTSLIIVAIYQVLLCFFLGCSGVSIVWCAVIGWYIHKSRCVVGQRNSEQYHIWYELLLLLPNASALLYYAITSEVITSIAHICALLLGMGMSKLEECCGSSERYSGI